MIEQKICRACTIEKGEQVMHSIEEFYKNSGGSKYHKDCKKQANRKKVLGVKKKEHSPYVLRSERLK